MEDDKATTVETKSLEQEEQEKQERNAEKETIRANAAPGSNRALLVLVITVCLISLAVLVLTLLMLFGKIGDGVGCSADEGTKDIEHISRISVFICQGKLDTALRCNRRR